MFNPLSPEFKANPYPYYDMLRAGAPIFFLPDLNMWFCTRYDDCSALLRDHRLGHEILKVMSREELGWEGETPEQYAQLVSIQRKWMLFSDPPDHTRLRNLVHKAFTPRMIERLREHIEAITADLLDAAAGKDEIDLIEDLAVPLPVTVIAEMLGVPLADQAMFRGWSSDLAGTLELAVNDRDTYDRAAQATAEFDRYFRDLAAQRRADPQDDLLTALVEAEEAGDKLTEEELIATCILLLIAGHETTVNLIGNGTLALLRNPEQMALLRDDPSLIKSAVEELLRYDSPVQMTTRWVLEDLELDGNQIKKGQQVAIMFAAANRDPARFENPNELDITRENNKHLSFGSGIHFCLGAPLARLEGQIAISAIIERLPGLELATDSPHYRDTYVLRGLKSLPVRPARG